MPLIKVDLLKGRSQDDITNILNAIHEAVLESFKVPVDDRYQIVTQHDSYEMIIKDTGLGIPRSEQVMVISITSKKRTEEAVKNFYHETVKNLNKQGLVHPNDVMINVTFNESYCWSFGNGEVQL